MKCYCEYCGKFLAEINAENKGTAAHKLQDLGYVAKIPVFHVKKCNGFVFFCNNEEYKIWINENSTEEERKKGDEIMEEIKAKMDEMKPELIEILQKMSTAFNNIKVTTSDSQKSPYPPSPCKYCSRVHPSSRPAIICMSCKTYNDYLSECDMIADEIEWNKKTPKR